MKKIKMKDKLTETVLETNMNVVKEKRKKNKSLEQKRGGREVGSRSKATVVDQHNIEAFKSDGANSEKSKRKLLKKKKRKRDSLNKSEIGKVDEQHHCAEDASDEQNGEHTQGKKKDGILRKKGRRTENIKKAGIDKVNVLHDKIEDDSKEENGKSRKARSSKNGHLSSKKEEKLLEKTKHAQNEIYEISSGDEDCSKGMRKWISEYHQNRPGLEILQRRIDDFMTTYEEQEEQARK